MPRHREQRGVSVTGSSSRISSVPSHALSSVTGPKLKPPGTYADGTVIWSTSISRSRPDGPASRRGDRRSGEGQLRGWCARDHVAGLPQNKRGADDAGKSSKVPLRKRLLSAGCGKGKRPVLGCTRELGVSPRVKHA